MNYVQTIGLNKLFTDNTFTTFTPDAIASGVNYNSIIYIVCQNDTASFGPEFKDGKTLIWAKGNFYGNNSESGISLYLTPPREYYVINDLTYYLKSPQNYPEAWEEWDQDLASATQDNEFTEEVSVQTYGFNPQFFVATKDDIETFKSEASQYNLKIFTYGAGKKGIDIIYLKQFHQFLRLRQLIQQILDISHRLKLTSKMQPISLS